MENNEKRITFIICYDDEQYLEESIYYINQIQIPRGFTVDVISIDNVSSIAEAYNMAMNKSDAKYKVYLDQRTFIINDLFLYEMLTIFRQNAQVGMLGVLGGNTSGELESGRVLIWDEDEIREINIQKESQDSYGCILNGMLMATQYDMEWQEECDVTHSLAMQEHGYEVIVPYQKCNWCIYDYGTGKIDEEYKRYRFLTKRVEIYHDIESAEKIENMLLNKKVDYQEHMEMVEKSAYSKTITGYFWEDFLMETRRRDRYIIPDGNVWMDENKENPMHVVMAFNCKYVVYAMVMLQSLYENNRLCNICVHVLHCELTQEDKQLLKAQAEGFSNEVVFYDIAKDYLPEGIKITKEWSIEAYFRLFMIDLLPETIDKVMYLDVDIIINKSIYDFYFMDMQGHDVVACRDFSLVLKKEFEDKRKELFAPMSENKDFIYFNSGVMLVNLEKLRGRMTGRDYVEAVEKLRNKVLAPDQDVLNAVHWQSVGIIDEYRYDFFNACLKGLKPKEVKQSVSIIHYAGPKPWMPIDITLHAHTIWWEYAKRISEKNYGM